jgi:hypothetical protein
MIILPMSKNLYDEYTFIHTLQIYHITLRTQNQIGQRICKLWLKQS